MRMSWQSKDPKMTNKKVLHILHLSLVVAGNASMLSNAKKLGFDSISSQLGVNKFGFSATSTTKII